MSDDRDHAGSESRRLLVRAASERPGPEAAATIARGLADPDWRVRKEAAAAAARLSDVPTMLTLLVDALIQSEDVGLRNAAIEAFGHIGPRAASTLSEALDRAPPSARKFICAAMASSGPQVVPALARMSADADPNTATVALESLAQIGGPAAEQVLRDRLSSEDHVVRLAALEGLARLGAQVPVAFLAPVTADPVLRRFALRLLGFCGDPEAAGHLARGLRDAASTAELIDIVLALDRLAGAGPGCAEAVTAEAQALGAPARAALRALLVDEDSGIAGAAAHVLVLARDLDALAPIAALAARVELPPPVIEALRALGPAAARTLLALSARLDAPARAWALEAAAELAVGSGEADPALAAEVRATLREALSAREENVVEAALRALAHWAEIEDAAHLVRLGASRSPGIARAAAGVLEALARAAPSALARALDQAPADGAEAWALAVAALPAEAALEKLRAAISSGEPGARRAAVEALDRIDGPGAAELAAVALADEDVDVRIAAATVLGRLRDPEARAIGSRTLRLVLRESSAPVRAAAARGLGALGDGEAAPALRELLKDPAPGVAPAALAALRALGVTRGMSEADIEALLADAFGHSDDEVVKEALLLVAESGVPRREVRLAIGLAHPSWDVRSLSASLLGEVGGPEAIALLRNRLAQESDDLVRAAIVAALGRAGGAD